MIRRSTGLLAIAAVITGSATAEAAPIPITSVTTAELLADFNAIVDGQFNSTSDTEGPVLIGGDLGPGAVALNQGNTSLPNGVVLGTTPGTTAITNYGEVDVFGNHTTTGTGNNNANGNVFVGGPAAGTFNGATSVTFNHPFPPGATVADNPTTFQNNIWSKMTSLSTSLAGMTATSMPTTTVFNGVPDANGVAVLSISLATLNGLTGTLSFTGCLAAATPCDAVIDVTGSGSFNNPMLSYGALFAGQQNLIWNFENATSLTVPQWFASILAPDAAVTNTGPINGDLVAASYTGSAELHFSPFDCSDNLCTDVPPSVPEPGSLALLGAALASLGLLRRRRA